MRGAVYTMGMQRTIPVGDEDDFKEFALVLRSALLMIVRWIERKYLITDKVSQLDMPNRVDPT